MSDHERAVLDAATKLQSAITDAVAAGYRVNWPGGPDGLDKIEMSTTAKLAADKQANLPKPAQVQLPKAPLDKWDDVGIK